MEKFLSSKGALHQLSCVETPQQNVVVEHKHQHILNVARALQFQSHLPLSFWDDCILIATYLINKLSSPLLDNKSPYEMLFSKPPSYTHLRVFGCLCYASSLHRNRSKFDSRARLSVFLGYFSNHKGYKLYDLQPHSYFVSRYMIFHEHIFSFDKSHSSIVLPHQSNSNISYFPITDGIFTLPLAFPDTLEFDNNYMIHSDHSVDNLPISSSSSIPFVSIPPVTSSPTPPITTLRKPYRTRCMPEYLHHCRFADYSLSSPHPSTPGIHFALSSTLSYDKVSPSYKFFCLSVFTNIEPQFYYQAVKHQHWRQAMSDEIHALEKNNTWILTDLPPCKKAIGCR
jgi:hypothetical protein